jgi:two-component system sensor histidine kinase DctS
MEDSALVGLRARDVEGRILYVNRTFCEMVGLPGERLLGLTPPMPYWPPEALDEVMVRNRRNLAGHAPREGDDTRWRHQDGRTLDVMVFESPLIDANGQQMGWMGSIIDITSRKALEERERHRTEAMAYQARLTTLGEIASALAHQLNQPLTAVMGYNAGLQRLLGDGEGQNPKVMAALHNQQLQASEAGRIVQRIREFLTRRTPKREQCDIALVARRAVDLLRRELEHRKIKVEWTLAEQIPAVYADAILAEQVLLNLVRNSADSLSGLTHTKRIGIAIHAAGAQFVRIDVQDNGAGLDGRTVEQLTAPFYSTKPDGMGMGLAICRSVIEVHYGSMDAGTGSFGGARFSFTLPIYVDHE